VSVMLCEQESFTVVRYVKTSGIQCLPLTVPTRRACNGSYRAPQVSAPAADAHNIAVESGEDHVRYWIRCRVFCSGASHVLPACLATGHPTGAITQINRDAGGSGMAR
jgi:hypothetical protein